MNLEELKQVEFLLSLGYVTIISSILTIIFMQIYKMILKKKKVITIQTDKNQKDQILSKAGRIIAIVIYSSCYLLNEYYLKHTIMLSETLLIGLISGGTATLTIAKGLYTGIRQRQKKKDVFTQLKEAQSEIEKLQGKLPTKIRLSHNGGNNDERTNHD